MPEVKNIFVGAKMNKDLNPRMISSKEYIDARNAAVINSEGSDSGLLQNVSGNTELTNFNLAGVNLEVIGFYIDTTNNRVFAFITDWNDASSDQLSNFASSTSHHYICVFDVRTNIGTVLVSGSFLNFSKTHPILGVNLLEDLLFFTDNRNQPRKINVETALSNAGYYYKEEHISVAKYYPYNAPRLVKERGDGSLLVNSSFRIKTNVDSIDNGTFITSTFTVSPIGGTGSDFQILCSQGAVIEVFAVVNNSDAKYYVGENFNEKDELTIPSGTLPGQVGDLVFIVEDVNMAKTSTMKDVVSENLPASISSEVINTSGSPTAQLEVPSGSITNNWIGATISQPTRDIGPGANVVIVDIIPGATDVINIENINGVDFNTDDIIVGANPDYEVDFNGDSSFLSDKFARFSYRFKFDDGEYSLIAPFSQIAFIPKQDGYFLDEANVPININDEVNISDENQAIKSTIVSFFENKINSLELVIDMPDEVETVSELIEKYKVFEVDILYKQSDQNTIKVVGTIDKDEIVSNSNKKIIYRYNSEIPIKTLPQNETTRASDKVPIRAKSQEVAGNRIIYGNYLVRTSRPSFLNYSISSDEKSELGRLNSVNEMEYPNHTLKQNRSYKVGVVLVDRFGRQSDVITSTNSTVYTPYVGLNPDYISNANNASSPKSLGEIYRGTSLKISFLSEIPEAKTSKGYAGLYSETNPTGWYSYKLVVQQNQQDYYNVYLPTILNNNPQDSDNSSKSTAFITLLSDNINKIPRDLKEVGPQEIQFSSSVELYPRISNSTFSSTEPTTHQVNTSRIPDKVVSIGTRDNLGLDVKLDGNDYTESPFYSIPDYPIKETTSTNRILNLGANPYIGKVATETNIGATGGWPAGNVTFENVRLNVYETKPFESSLDIYYETSTSGIINDLNKGIISNTSNLVPAQVSDWSFILNENYSSNQTISAVPFDVLNYQGVSLTSIYGQDINVEILSIVDGFDNILSNNIFKIEQQSSFPFKFELKTGDNYDSFVYLGPDTSYTINLKLTNLNNGINYASNYTIPSSLNKVLNSPVIESTGLSYEIKNDDFTTQLDSSYRPYFPLTEIDRTNKQIRWNGQYAVPTKDSLTESSPQWATLQEFEFKNGANSIYEQDKGLQISIDTLDEFADDTQNLSNIKIQLYGGIIPTYRGFPSIFFDKTVDYSNKIRLRKSNESGTIKYILEYSKELRPYNENANEWGDVYSNIWNPTWFPGIYYVYLRVKDANNLAGSLGMSTVNIDDSSSSLFSYRFRLAPPGA